MRRNDNFPGSKLGQMPVVPKVPVIIDPKMKFSHNEFEVGKAGTGMAHHMINPLSNSEERILVIDPAEERLATHNEFFVGQSSMGASAIDLSKILTYKNTN